MKRIPKDWIGWLLLLTMTGLAATVFVLLRLLARINTYTWMAG
jgi:hypothetical protein